MWAQHSKIETENRKLIFIGNGPAWAIKGFKEDLKIDSPIYTDPSLKTYEAAGLKKGKFETLGPRAIFNALILFIKGNRQRGVQGDPFQQGGVLVVKQGGNLTYKYVSKAVGDEPDTEDILKAEH